MKKEQGSLAINSDNIFPIIKKWLYSDHDIFIRELVSNVCDAITKLTKFGKKRLNKYKTYYIKVVAKIKVGKKTVSNCK